MIYDYINGDISMRSRNSFTSRRTPGLTKALEYLSDVSTAGQIISIRRMAQSADVSYVTMWKAVKLHKTKSQKRTTATGTVRNDQVTTNKKTRVSSWRRLKAIIEKDLLHGHLTRTGTLPPIKELSVRYRAGSRAVKKALDALCGQQILQRGSQRYYSIAGSSHPTRSLKIGILVRQWVEGPFVLFSDYDKDFLPALEIECQKENVSLVVLQYAFSQNSILIKDTHGMAVKQLDKQNDIVGFVIPVYQPECLNDTFLAALHALQKPVVIIDEFGECRVPSLLKKSRLSIIITARPYMTAARNAAHAIIALGHHHAGYFSAFHADGWSHRCLEGLQDVFSTAGQDYQLTSFLQNYSQLENVILPFAQKFCNDSKIRVYYHKWKRRLPLSYTSQLDAHFSTQFDIQMWFAELRRILEPLFMRALSDKSITCWIAACGDTVWCANDFLSSRRSELSLISFGHSPEITQNRITTWDFNITVAARASLSHLVYPEKQLSGQTASNLEIEGFLINRETLRPVI
jgi:hypothetical protein